MPRIRRSRRPIRRRRITRRVARRHLRRIPRLRRGRLSGVSVHPFVDKNQNVRLYSMVLPSTNWTTSPNNTQIIGNSGSGDTIYCSKPRLNDSNLFNALSGQFQYVRFTKFTIYVVPNTAYVTAARNSTSSGISGTAYTSSSRLSYNKSFDYLGYPVDGGGNPMTSLNNSFANFLDTPKSVMSSFPKLGVRGKNFTHRPKQLNTVVSSQNITSTSNLFTFNYVPMKKLPCSQAVNIESFGHMFCFETAQSTNDTNACNISCKYYFTMYQPY